MAALQTLHSRARSHRSMADLRSSRASLRASLRGVRPSLIKSFEREARLEEVSHDELTRRKAKLVRQSLARRTHAPIGAPHPSGITPASMLPSCDATLRVAALLSF